MKNVLFVATVDSHIRHFHIPYLKYFKDKGYEVHVATSNDENEKFDYCDKKHTVTFERSPFKINNLKAIKQMKEILKEEKFDIVHCHTPMGGVVTRIAAKEARKKGTKVFYTAHGFHFFKGAPLINWLLYYPIEKWLSKYTDVLITINKEDYEYAKKFKAKRVEKIDGIGVDSKRFKIQLLDEERNKLKDEFSIKNDDIVLTYVGELNSGKNQIMLMEAMQEIIKEIPNIKLLLVGKGKLEAEYKEKIKELNLENNVILTGYRKDVPQIFKITDIAVSTSKREGLPINLVEAQMSGLPIVATNVRGNNELVCDEENGYLIEDKENLIEKIKILVNDKILRDTMGKKSLKHSEKYNLENVLNEMIEIYNK